MFNVFPTQGASSGDVVPNVFRPVLWLANGAARISVSLYLKLHNN